MSRSEQLPEQLPSYTVPLNKWVEIWFSTNPNQVFPELNKNRIRDFFARCPHLELTLIYDSRLLNETGIADLNHFPSTLPESANFSFLDFSSEPFKSEIVHELEKKLYDIADAELRNLHNGGNPAAASDIMRLLAPAYRRGIYKDNDVYVHNNINPDTLATLETMFNPAGCNDVICVPSDEESSAAIVRLRKIQGHIFVRYKNFSKILPEAYKTDPMLRSIGTSNVLSDYIYSDPVDKCVSHWMHWCLLRHGFYEDYQKLFYAEKKEKRIDEMTQWMFVLRRSIKQLPRCSFTDRLLMYTVMGATGPYAYPRGIDHNALPNTADFFIISQITSRDFLSQELANQISRLYEYENDASWVSLAGLTDVYKDALTVLERENPETRCNILKNRLIGIILTSLSRTIRCSIDMVAWLLEQGRIKLDDIDHAINSLPNDEEKARVTKLLQTKYPALSENLARRQEKPRALPYFFRSAPAEKGVDTASSNRCARQ